MKEVKETGGVKLEKKKLEEEGRREKTMITDTENMGEKIRTGKERKEKWRVRSRPTPSFLLCVAWPW